MKKKIFGGIAVVAIAAVAAWNVNLNSQDNELSNVYLANVEALANGESTPINPSCWNGGVGSSSCSIDGGIQINGYGVSSSCSVSCTAGYYACCGIRCTCKRS
jgi:hypothetical protein